MKRLLPYLAALVLVVHPTTLNSCGPDYTTGEDYRFWLLQPEIAGSRQLHAYYFTSDLLYGVDYDQITSMTYDANIAEWQAVVGNGVSADDIATILYGTEPVDYFKHEDALFRTNPFMQALARLKNGWPAYINYAKRCEQLVNSEDPWGFIPHDGEGIRKAFRIGQAQLNSAKHPMLRARLAFQLVRLAHHGYDPERADLDARPYYEKYLMPLRGRSWMEASAAFYLACSQANPQRDLDFAEIFDRVTDKQFRMVQLFVSREVENYLALAKDDQHRATLLVMRDLQHPGRALEDLERIAAWDPGNRHLPLLLTREVNKLEDWLLTPTLTEYDAAIRQWQEREEGLAREDVLRADLLYLRQVQAFIARITPEFGYREGALLTLLNGHLSFVAGDLSDCYANMVKVEKDPNAAGVVRAQARLDRILCGTLMNKALSNGTREDILALVRLLNTEPDLEQHRSELLGQLHLYLGMKLIERGEAAEGLFLLARSERHFGNTMVWNGKNARHVAFERATPEVYDRMIALLDKPDKTSFERYLTATDERPDGWERTEDHFRETELTREKLLDYKATWFLNRDRLEEAAAAFAQIPDDFWNGYPYSMFAEDDPFVVNVEDAHNYGKSDVNRYNKRTIVERMIALRKEAELNPKRRAVNNYLLGNAYFSMTWHGKYWIMSRIAWSMWEDGDWNEPTQEKRFDDADYFGCQRAKRHYEQAFRTAKDPVLKAMACRMLVECDRNWRSFSGQPDTDESPWVDLLKDKKSREAYRAIEECVSYSVFVQRFK
ncbi:MAG: hypothetical protein JNL52_05110 [Flavobacteriales bacterium]|nr:hypothetical protein [Flavobacteriales bacterium]